MATEPRIDRIKTECYLVDRTGAEWQVWDLARRPDRTWRECYPTEARAEYRLFRRWLYRGGSSPIALEVRAYRFRPREDRWFVAERWVEQLGASELRGIRIDGYPRLPDGYLYPRKRGVGAGQSSPLSSQKTS